MWQTQGVSLTGASVAFCRSLQLIEKLAKLSAPVLVEGETGTGKDRAARAIHYLGARRDRPFVAVNCGAFPDSLFESELFGHVKGAFTNACADQAGLVESANYGTLFLDEIDALTPKAQVAILRFLQDGTYRPVGSHLERNADVRIVAASNADLNRLEANGIVRTDLLYRLRILNLRLPPLRERGDDALLLARAFLDKCKRENKCKAVTLDESSCDWFSRYRWPGNIRELEGLVYREAMLSDETTLRLAPPEDFSPSERWDSDARITVLTDMPYTAAKAKVIDKFTRQYLAALLAQSEGNVTRAARVAGKERRAFGKLLKKHGLNTQSSGRLTL